MEARRPAAFGVNAPPYKVEARRSAAFGVNLPPYKVEARLERGYTMTLYGGAPPCRFRCKRASIQSQRIDAFQAPGAWNASIRMEACRPAAFGVNAA